VDLKKEIRIPSLLKIGEGKLRKIGKYLYDRQFMKVVLFFSDGIEGLVTDKLYAGFSEFGIEILNKNSIKNIKTHYINIEYQNLLGSSSSTGGQSYYDSYAILNGEIDVILKNVMFENGRLILTFNGDTASGTIEYSKSSINININDSGNKVETQSDYFGIQPIDFTVK